MTKAEGNHERKELREIEGNRVRVPESPTKKRCAETMLQLGDGKSKKKHEVENIHNKGENMEDHDAAIQNKGENMEHNDADAATIERRKRKWLKKVARIGTNDPVRYCDKNGCGCAYHSYCWTTMFLEAELLKDIGEKDKAVLLVEGPHAKKTGCASFESLAEEREQRVFKKEEWMENRNIGQWCYGCGRCFRDVTEERNPPLPCVEKKYNLAMAGN